MTVFARLLSLVCTTVSTSVQPRLKTWKHSHTSLQQNHHRSQPHLEGPSGHRSAMTSASLFSFIKQLTAMGLHHYEICLWTRSSLTHLQLHPTSEWLVWPVTCGWPVCQGCSCFLKDSVALPLWKTCYINISVQTHKCMTSVKKSIYNKKPKWHYNKSVFSNIK